MSELPQPRHDTTDGKQGRAQMPVIEVEAVLGSAREIVVRHRDEEYRLRVTRNQKLILTK